MGEPGTRVLPRPTFLVLAAAVSLLVVFLSCEMSPEVQQATISTCTEQLDSADVAAVVAQGVAQASLLSESVTIAITDREGNVLGLFEMTSSAGTSSESIQKARTAAYLSSNQHGFTSLTACFITRPHFPPGVANTPGGPLYGVPISSLQGGDVQPNPGPLSGAPGGVPLFKGECLVGAVGVSGGRLTFDLATCSGESNDEVIALGASLDYQTPPDKRGDNIFLEGVRLLYANSSPPARGAMVPLSGSFLTPIDPPFPGPSFPDEGVVMLGGIFDFPVIGGAFLTASDVQRIIDQAANQAAKTRAAIRRPIGSPARVFISVVDIDGSILGIWRTPDATLFSFDVSAQKARTAVAFSNPDLVEFGRRIRTILGVPGQIAMTTRAVGFLAQDFFPPGIDRNTLGNPMEPGPLWEGPEFAYQARLAMFGGLPPFGNGITIFPGGIPLYKNGQLAGAIGISGDGVDQDDLIAFAGSAGFEPPAEIRCDQFFYDEVRLPFVKFPRNPELP